MHFHNCIVFQFYDSVSDLPLISAIKIFLQSRGGGKLINQLTGYVENENKTVCPAKKANANC